MKLRLNQKEPALIGQEYFKIKKMDPSIIVAPTAFGKSILIAHITNTIEDKVLILQPSKELLEQNYDKFTNIYGGEASIFSASLGEKEIGRVTYATIGSVANRIYDFKKFGFKKVIIDECFHYDSFVSTSNGVVKIGTLYKKIKSGQDIYVKSFNIGSNKFEFKKVTHAIKTEKKDIFKFHFSHGRILKCTGNHPILTIDGYKNAENLVDGDAVIFSSNESCRDSFKQLNDDQFDFVIGNIIGDGSLDSRHYKNSARIRIVHGQSQMEYLKWKCTILNSEYGVINEAGYSNTPSYRTASPTFYFKEKYRDYKNIIDELNFKSLAIAYMDDGSLSKKQNSLRLYSFANNHDLVYKLKTKLVDMGFTSAKIHQSKSSSTNNPYWYISILKQDYNLFFSSISQYIHPSLEYKVIDSFKHLVGSYEWNNVYKNNVSIYSHSEYYTNDNCYDITVMDNSNFVVCAEKYRKMKDTSGEGIVVHNCDRYPRAKSGQLRTFLDKIKATHVLGLTATPLKLQTLSMDGGWERYSRLTMLTNRTKHGTFFKHILYCAQIKEMVDMGFWSPLRYESYDFDERQLVLNSTKGDYTEESMEKAYNKGNIEDKIIERIKYLNDRRSILVALPTVKQAESLAKKLPNAELLHGGTPSKERKDIIERFKSGKLKTICQVNVLTVGFDYPKLDCIITARPTNSLSWWYQFVGRVTRIDPDKEKKDGLVIDFVGSVKKFGIVEELYFKEIDGRWELYGEGGRQITGIPMHEIGLHYEGGVNLKTMDEEGNRRKPVIMPFGKYKDKEVHEIPISYRKWMLENFNWKPWNMEIKNEIIRLGGIN